MRAEAANRVRKIFKQGIGSFCDCGEPKACHATGRMSGVACELGDSARGSGLTSGLAWNPEPLQLLKGSLGYL